VTGKKTRRNPKARAPRVPRGPAAPPRPLAIVMLDGVVDAEFKRGKRWDMRGKACAAGIALVEGLLERGFDVVIGSSFVRPGKDAPRDSAKLETWLRKNGFPAAARACPKKPPPRGAATMTDLVREGVVRINTQRFVLELGPVAPAP